MSRSSSRSSFLDDQDDNQRRSRRDTKPNDNQQLVKIVETEEVSDGLESKQNKQSSKFGQVKNNYKSRSRSRSKSREKISKSHSISKKMDNDNELRVKKANKYSRSRSRSIEINKTSNKCANDFKYQPKEEKLMKSVVKSLNNNKDKLTLQSTAKLIRSTESEKINQYFQYRSENVDSGDYGAELRPINTANVYDKSSMEKIQCEEKLSNKKSKKSKKSKHESHRSTSFY